MKNVLEFDSIELTLNKHKVLSSIHVQCSTGEVVGLLGRNGSGKSSMMKIVFGTMDCDYKSVRINGQLPERGYRNARVISYLPQEHLIPPFLTIGEALKLFKISPEEIDSLFPIRDMLRLKPKQLSGGSLRIIECLMILKSPAHFCLLDEPFSGIAPVLIERLSEIIMQEKVNKGIIITDHLYRHIISLADQLYMLKNGKTYKVSNQEELISHGYLSDLPGL